MNFLIIDNTLEAQKVMNLKFYLHTSLCMSSVFFLETTIPMSVILTDDTKQNVSYFIATCKLYLRKGKYFKVI